MNILTLNQLSDYAMDANEQTIAKVAGEIALQAKDAGSLDDINGIRTRVQNLIVSADTLSSPKKEAVKNSLEILNDAIGQWRATLGASEIGTRIYKNLVSFNADIMNVPMVASAPKMSTGKKVLYTVLGLGVAYFLHKKFLKKK